MFEYLNDSSRSVIGNLCMKYVSEQRTINDCASITGFNYGWRLVALPRPLFRQVAEEKDRYRERIEVARRNSKEQSAHHRFSFLTDATKTSGRLWHNNRPLLIDISIWSECNLRIADRQCRRGRFLLDHLYKWGRYILAADSMYGRDARGASKLTS